MLDLLRASAEAKQLVRESDEEKNGSSKVSDADFIANFDLLKIFIATSINPEFGIPVLSDFRVALVHLSCVHKLHPEVRKRGLGLWRSWTATRAVVGARKTAILKKMFARQMQWVTEDGDWVDRIEADVGHDPDGAAAAPESEPDNDTSPADEIELDNEMHRLLSSQSISKDGEDIRDLSVEAMLKEMDISDDDFAGPEDVPHPSEVFTPKELEDFEKEVPQPSEGITPGELEDFEKEAEDLKDEKENASGAAMGWKDRDRKALVPNDLPDELLELLKPQNADEIDANSTLTKQREIKHTAKAEAAAAKASLNSTICIHDRYHDLEYSFLFATASTVQVSGKGKGRGKGKKGLKRKATEAELKEVSTPPPTEKEAPASDPLQKKSRGRRGNKQAKAAAKEFADDEKHEDAAEEVADDEKQGDAAEEVADDEKQDVAAAEGVANDEKQDVAKKPVKTRRGRRSGKNLTPEQLEAKRVAMEKSQAVADKNLVTIRAMANQHPELQPQLGFTAKSFTVCPPRGEEDFPEINPITVNIDKKKGSTVSWLKHGGASRAWLLATFLAGWHGDVDPLDEQC
ncbi:unnamed protein product [Symbiodinium sp. CCMP2592]|nr:unnamed protein product [Symbiodinium sp. CCMP2592]